MTNVNELQCGITSTEPMEISANIDWISATYPYTGDKKSIARVLPDDHNGEHTIIRATMGYDTALQYKSGAMMLWHTKHPNMGIHVVYSAKAIASACENFGIEQWEIIDYLSIDGKITRLDVALDVANVPIDIRQLHSDALSGKIKTRTKSIDYVESAKVGQEHGARTLYLGSMKKRKKLLRIYDKGMQLNLNNYLTRFELETHGQIAHNAALGLTQDIERMAQSISGMIKGYADMSQSVPSEVFTSDAIKIALPKYKKSDTANWLIDIVAKTLAKEVYSNPDVLKQFSERFIQEYGAIASEWDNSHNVNY